MSIHARLHPEIDNAGLPPAAPSANRPTACSREGYVQAMRQVAGAVAVVTTDGVAGRHGATVTAFCSVSADPPTVLVCLRHGSRIGTAVAANGVFTLNVLPEDAAAVARTFAGEFDRQGDDRFARVDPVALPGLAPAIAGALALACRVVRADRQDSHVIVVGTVVSIVHRPLAPLVYHDGGYRALQPTA
ncbi:MAG: flavin reductase family protein [Gemmobacter sp.]